jgi:hypothetical protein
VFLEVIFEDLQLKRRVLGELLPQLPEQVLFWSNTSSLDIDKLASAGGRPERSIITHGFNPVPMMPGVEVVPGARTSPETIEFTRRALLAMKKAPFLAPNIPGFWVTRLHKGPPGSAVRRGRRTFFPGPRNGSRAAQIVPESPGRDRPTTETAAAACEGLIETPGALSQPGCFFEAAPADGRPQRALAQKPK